MRRISGKQIHRRRRVEEVEEEEEEEVEGGKFKAYSPVAASPSGLPVWCLEVEALLSPGGHAGGGEEEVEEVEEVEEGTRSCAYVVH
ncbi:hypothetical protein EYF80_038765 [Liparis tanakae]|uniref:Uncharacterized protein n=1 Tax=Liparis tanakae TaxID=230148 RepID=A0A4Z2GD24_9TELE|nr:hypothetical protein EYF80_038765 [Liparis tanakae]